jgi:hypothetical protein
MKGGRNFGNVLLDSLPKPLQDHLEPMLRRVALERDDLTTCHSSRMTHVDFPVDAVMALLAVAPNGETAEVAVVGREGFVEIDAALESQIAERTSVCQIPGTVLRMSLADFQSVIERDRHFARVVRRSARARIFVTEQIAMCNANHTILERFARWLLMLQDRSTGNEFALTHEVIAAILGVRRAGVSAVIATLRLAGAIESEYMMVRIVDAKSLAQASCECYELSRAAIARILQDERID